MTEDSRRSVDDPPREEGAPGAVPPTADDIVQVPGGEPAGDQDPSDLPADPPRGEEPADAGFAPPDAPGPVPGDKLLVSAPPPMMEMSAAGPEAPPPPPQYEPYGQPPPPYQEAPAPVRSEQPPPPPYQEPSPYGQEPSQSAFAPEGRGRPGFVPPNQDPQGWPPPPHQGPLHQGPPPPSGPPLSTTPPPPGAAPLGSFGGPAGPAGPGGPGGAPNWAPVPAPPSARRGGVPLGVLAVIALIVALVAGAMGAGIGVMATDDSPGTVSLGGGGGGGQNKVRPPDSVAGIAQKVTPSVVTVRVNAGGDQSGGTGFIVNGGYIITNNHVVSPAASGGQIEIVFHDKKTSPAQITGRDPTSDIAVLKPQTTHSLPALQMGDSDSLAVGDPVIAIGSPLGLDGSVTAGIVSALNRAVPTQGEGADASVIPAIQTDAAINPGNSGGPLVDGSGRVVGINTAIVTLGGGLGEQGGNIGLGFAIPINHGRRIAQEIINTGSAKRTLLGIGMDPAFPGPGVRIADREQNGVQPIVPNGPADKAGLRPGDIITAIDGKVVQDQIELSAAIQAKAPGTRVKVTFRRGGQEQTVDVVLAAAN
ncbi:S1C family serine protease [Thermomonospora amylolytica]|uniref:S1C family serine protease n=1 Tax=Thermomonospora amylolytica TaxID=1411117 RepID=UPI0018E5768B|nr:trypsin-like peptidase domain-containing protein [Thermomonospora amylolytica]